MSKTRFLEWRRQRGRNLLRLRKVNRAIARLEEWEASLLMPEEIRPAVEKPTLGRNALESLRETLEEVLKEQEEMWERRH